MPLTPEQIGSFKEMLNEPFDDVSATAVFSGEAAHKFNKAVRKLDYVKMPGVTTLSFSKGEKLHECARRFQLSELETTGDFQATVHTAFGHAFGAGIQEYLRTGSRERAWLSAFSAWDYWDIYGDSPKKTKSLWSCFFGLDKFINEFWPRMQEEWELAIFPSGRNGIELNFVLAISEEYIHQGHIDIVLRNKITGELAIFEIKTTEKVPHEADWQNSEQTIGYNAALDVIVHKFLGEEQVASSYIVHYLVYDTMNCELHHMAFTKSPAAKIEFATTLLMRVQTVQMYRENELFPKNGKACKAYNRVCPYFGVCDLESFRAAKGVSKIESYEGKRLEDIEFVFSIEDLLAAQNLEEHDTTSVSGPVLF